MKHLKKNTNIQGADLVANIEINKHDYRDHNRQEYKQRTGFNDTQYYKVVSLSLKFYEQAVKTGKDIEGNSLTPEEIAICDGLVSKMKREMELHREQFLKDQEE
jgi:hypothetical protein